MTLDVGRYRGIVGGGKQTPIALGHMHPLG